MQTPLPWPRQMRAEEKLQKEVMANPKVEIIRDTVPVRVVGEDTVTKRQGLLVHRHTQIRSGYFRDPRVI